MRRQKKHVYLGRQRMSGVVDRFVAGEKLSVLAAENNIALSTISRAAKSRGVPPRVTVPNKCPHCGERLK